MRAHAQTVDLWRYTSASGQIRQYLTQGEALAAQAADGGGGTVEKV
ncbi:hypothetical protein ACEZCY_14155 [Streptacidiphilus sp. N1-12]|uniref:Uncharacterized protein n=2 Tax=Streptacidiphilus alkalitolerans TaxID=3342712 RepID=A0ABV6WEA7_9ACTN